MLRREPFFEQTLDPVAGRWGSPGVAAQSLCMLCLTDSYLNLSSVFMWPLPPQPRQVS